MFEEDFERCFICQAPCKGLYCSSQCRLQDQGQKSPAKATPLHLTSQLPPALSPLIRPTHMAPSPRMPPHMVPGDSSSNSSITSSPLHSPATNPAGADSPNKELFDLPPPAFPGHLAFGSVPVKIPALVPRPSPGMTPIQGTPLHGTSIDTLRFGRKSGVINSITSPNALNPRCACGKPANHRSRAGSKDRGAESDFARLTLGPSVLQPQTHSNPTDKPRVTSEGARACERERRAASGCSTPQHDLSLGASLLSRSRSDPIPPNLQHRGAHAHTQGPYDFSPSRRASAAAVERPNGRPRAMDMTRSGSNDATDGRRGRSRSRARHPVDVEPATAGLLNHPPEREAAPSRSRHRRDEREREAQRERRSRAISDLDHSLRPIHAAPITPSWSRHAEAGEGVAPLRRSPKGCGEQQRGRSERDRDLEQARAL